MPHFCFSFPFTSLQLPAAGDLKLNPPLRWVEKGASDVHRAEWIERRTISVESEALHNGYRYEVPIEVFVRVEGPQIQAL